jgi:hypothetical protein
LAQLLDQLLTPPQPIGPVALKGAGQLDEGPPAGQRERIRRMGQGPGDEAGEGLLATKQVREVPFGLKPTGLLEWGAPGLKAGQGIGGGGPCGWVLRWQSAIGPWQGRIRADC